MKNLFSVLFILVSIIACQSGADQQTAAQDAAGAEAAQQNTRVNIPETNDVMCFQLKDGNAARPDVTTVRIAIQGDRVSGKMSWEPYEKHAAQGTLQGAKYGDTLRMIYSYTIEGADQVESLEFLLNGDKLIKREGELHEIDGVLVLKDPASATFSGKPLTRVACN